MLSIRQGDWKLLLNPNRSRVELYNIPKDPMELDNVAGQQPELVKKMAQRALQWQATLPKGPVASAAGSNAYPWPRAEQ